MNDNELHDLWQSQPQSNNTKGNDMLEMVQKKLKKFDRMIAWRNRIECIAAAAVAIFLTWTALHVPNAVMKVGCMVVVGGAAWIVFYMLRYGSTGAAIDPNTSLANYTQALVGRYDRQIRLLKSVKYWYLLPMYVGLLILSVGMSMQRAQLGAPAWLDLIAPAICTVVFGVIWWINEVPAVRRLTKERAQVLSITGQFE
jgi:hypothetical protein